MVFAATTLDAIVVRLIGSQRCVTAKIQAFGFHTTRHLTAFTLVGIGAEIGIIQTVLRHKRANTTERYLRSIELEGVRAALEELTRSRKAKAIPFPRSREKAVGGSEK